MASEKFAYAPCAVFNHDLLRAQSTNPLYLADRVGRCATVEALREVVAEALRRGPNAVVRAPAGAGRADEAIGYLVRAAENAALNGLELLTKVRSCLGQ